MKNAGIIHSADGIKRALEQFDGRRSRTGAAVLEQIAHGLRATPAVMVELTDLEPEEEDAVVVLGARQVLADLAELVLPNIHLTLANFKREQRIVETLMPRLSYETLVLGPTVFLRWIIAGPSEALIGNVDQLEHAKSELPERIRVFSDEVGSSKKMLRYHAEQFALAGLPPVHEATDLTADHVLLLGAMHTVKNYGIIAGQRIPTLIRWVYERQWKTLTNPAAKRFISNLSATQKTKFSMRGYGFPLAELTARARRSAKPAVRERREHEAETRRAARQVREAEKLRRREDAHARERAAAAAIVLEVEARSAAQRDSLKRKSQRDRDRWEQARVARDAAASAVDRRNRELLDASKKDARQRKGERALEREEGQLAAEVARCSALDEQRCALPSDLRGPKADALINLLKRDARCVESTDGERAIVAEWDHVLHSIEWTLEVDPDLRGTVETWLRNEYGSDEWLEHLERRRSEGRKQATELRLLDAQRARQCREATEEEAATAEAERTPGERWSEHLQLLDGLTTEERIERLKGCGYVGPPTGFGTLERHLHGDVTERERRDYGKERWQDIGSAYAELRALERLAFYRVTVRFARELPGVLNPDFLIIDTIGELASVARIRPMDVKKIYLDRVEEGRSREENAAYHFTQKLEKAGRQLAEGMRRYGHDLPDRRLDGFRDEVGGTVLFVLQSRDPDLHRSGYLDAVCERLSACLLTADAERSIEAVDCVLLILDYVDGRRLQRPIWAVHRSSASAGSVPSDQDNGWTERHPYIDYLTSEHNVERCIGDRRNLRMC